MIAIGFLTLLSIIYPNLNLRAATASFDVVLARNSNAVGKVVAIDGTANISRPNVRRPIRVRRNVQLIPGDELRVENSSTVKIICFADFQSVSLPAGPHSNICPANQSADVFTENINRGRPEIIRRPNGEVILRPRANDYPEFLAKIIDGRPEYWASSISLKKLIQNDTRSDLVDRIRALPSNISEDEKRLLLVDVYSMNKVYDRAIDELNHVSNAADDPFIQINLGDLYLASSQSGDAKRAYSSAIRAAVAANEPMAEALAQHAFGLLLQYEKARIAEATKALARAICLYRDLGENGAADALESEWSNSQTPPPRTH
jgi:tetratricopeptide (TPR) repeat protein